MVIERACQRLGWKLAEQGCVVQGFGNVGGIAARELAARGAKLLAVSDISGGIYSPGGLDYDHLRTWVDENGSLAEYPDVERVSNSELLELPCDILVLAALEEQLTAENAPRDPVPARRRGRERPDDDRGGRDPGRARDPRVPGRADERGRRHGLVLRVGAGPRTVVLGSRGDQGAARGQAQRRVRPRVGSLGASRICPCGARRSWARSARSPRALESRGIYP